jgi:DNA-binding SARP family transcriptional activator/tetratricopeptide (TPR) repeat protein
MRYRLLGPVEVIGAGGDPVALSGERERTLLATLALGAGQTVSVARLIDALWGERPPATAVNTLQVHVSNLRKKLAGAGATQNLRSVPEGYALRAGPDEIDAMVFARLVEGATGAPAEVATRLREALSLWRGPALADVRSDLLQGEKTRLEELRLLVVERRIDAELVLGLHNELVGELEALVYAHPLREGIRRQLMVALYRSGRQADALAVYQAGREVLAEELGIDPSPESRALEVAILRQDPELAGPANRLAAAATTASGSTAIASVPLPLRLGIKPVTGLVGRESEKNALTDALKRVSAGQGREVVLITGEPGIGKSALAAELAQTAFERGSCVLLGRCDEEVGAPYRPFQEALSHLVTHADDELIRAHVVNHGGELARMVPELGRRLGELPPAQTSDADTERYLLCAAAVGLLEEASRRSPVVLVFDDLHWADKPSLQLLRHLVANTSSVRLLIVGTYRDAELSASHPLNEALAGLHREPAGVSTIDLRGLDDTGIIAFMESAAGQELDQAGVGLAHQLYRETDGNPFFVTEILRTLSESGDIFLDATTGRWTAKHAEGPLSLPHSVRAVIGTRVSRLGEEAIKVLSTASVIGRDFDLDLLAETTQVDEDELIDLLEGAQHAAVVDEFPDSPGRYTFSHALVQHTLYEDLGAARRTRIHRAVGEAIERLDGPNNETRIAELARHFLMATRPIDSTKAISYAQRAGDAALAALAPDHAVRHFSQALELAGHGIDVDPTVRIDLLLGLGTAQRQAGIPQFRTTLLDAARRARELSDTGRLVAAALANNRGWFSSLGQVDRDRVEVIEAALDALPVADSPERARLLATLCAELTFRSPLEHRLALANEAKAMARRLGDRATFLDVVCSCSGAVWFPSTLATELADHSEAIAAARDLDDPVGLLRAASLGYALAARAGQFVLAEERLAIARAMAKKLGEPSLVWLATCGDASYALLRGDTEEAEQLATAAFEMGVASGQPDAFAFYGAQIMRTCEEQGRSGELVSLVASAANENPSIPTYKAALATTLLESGDRNGAQQLVGRAAAELFSLPEDVAWLEGIIGYATVVIELHLGAQAEQLIELLAPFRNQVPHNTVVPHSPVATFLGGLASVLGRFEEGEAYFTEAAELSRQGRMKFAEAHTNMLWGRMLRTRNESGDAHRARSLLEQARVSAATRGYATVERQAMAELSALAS